MEDNKWTTVTVGVVAALFIVWMQRHQRWGYFFEGLTGKLVIVGSRIGTNPANTGTSGGSGSSGSGTAPTPPPGIPAGATSGQNPQGIWYYIKNGVSYVFQNNKWNPVPTGISPS